MVTKEEMMSRFMKLEKVDWGEDNTGLIKKRFIEEVTKAEDIIIPKSKDADFYRLCDIYNTFNVEYKIYSKDYFFIVEVIK